MIRWETPVYNIYEMCIRDRDWWETFAEMEAELRQMMDEDKDHTRGAELVAQMEETLNLVFDEISFEMGFNGKKHELILTPEGDKVKLFELVYFQKHAPKEVLELSLIHISPVWSTPGEAANTSEKARDNTEKAVK